jgi:GNAT superfamily N-acetyltransferase
MRVFMNESFFQQKGFIISTDPSMIDCEVVYKYLNEESYWSKGIPEGTFETAIRNSFCFGVYQQNKQAGFARVITDKATFAYICDVFILAEFRGMGLSKWLIETIVNHAELQGLRRWLLATADAHGLYNQLGFIPITSAERWMEIFTPYKPV